MQSNVLCTKLMHGPTNHDPARHWQIQMPERGVRTWGAWCTSL